MTVSADVYNVGGTAVSAPFNMEFYVDNVLTDTRTINSLNGFSANSRQTFSISLLQGSHTIKVIADSAGAVAEASETNNVATRTFNIAPPNPPNLRITAADISFIPEKPAFNSPVTVNVDITNSGQVGASTLSLFIQGVPIGSKTISVPALSTITESLAFTTPINPGYYIVTAVVQSAQEASSTLGDNSATRVMEVIGLTVSLTAPSDGATISGNAVPVTAGSASATSVNFYYNTGAGDVLIGTDSEPADGFSAVFDTTPVTGGLLSGVVVKAVATDGSLV